MKLKCFLVILVTLFCISCKAGSQTQQLQFETLSGSISKPVAESGLPFDSISVNYEIAWPVKGNSETIAFVKSQIINLIGNNDINKKDDVEACLNSIASEMAQSAGEDYVTYRSITIQANEDCPFESYLSIRKDTEDGIYMTRMILDTDAIAIRLTDNTLFPGSNAIGDEKMMQGLITVYLEKTGKSKDSDWQWHENIKDYAKYQVPMPGTPLILTKEGVLVHYNQYEISDGVSGIFECVIPYDEVIYALNDEAREFLNMKADSPKTEQTPNPSDLDEATATELIKKANRKENSALSKDFKGIVEMMTDIPGVAYELESAWFEEGIGGKTLLSKNGNSNIPDIKIHVYDIWIHDSGDSATVAFYFSPIINGKYNESELSDEGILAAVELKFEDGKWVVDDIGQEVIYNNFHYYIEYSNKDYYRDRLNAAIEGIRSGGLEESIKENFSNDPKMNIYLKKVADYKKKFNIK